jgi:hypothetical protein
VNEATPADKEASMFDGLDVTLQRFAATVPTAQKPAFDSLTQALTTLRTQLNYREPSASLPVIDRARHLLDRWCTRGQPARSDICRGEEEIPRTLAPADADLVMSAARTFAQLQQLGAVASGLLLEATVNRQMVAEGDTGTLTLRITNRGTRVARVSVFTPSGAAGPAPKDTIAPGEAYVTTLPLPTYTRSAPWWIRRRSDDALLNQGNAIVEPTARFGDMFVEPASLVEEEARSAGPGASVPALVDGIPVQLNAPIVFRRIDEVKGQLDTPVMFVPRVAISIDGGQASYVRAATPMQRVMQVRVTANGPVEGPVTLRLVVPRGISVDSAVRTVALTPGTETLVPFTLRGTLPRGRHVISVSAEARVGGAPVTFATGFQRIEYDHIRPQHIYRPAAVALEAVETGAPPAGLVGYIDGLADNVMPALVQLGATVEKLPAAAISATGLTRFRVIMVGPRALEAQPALASKMPLLQAWVKNGGTMIVQYQQGDIGRPGMAPFPMTFARPAARVTEEDAAVRVLRADSPLLNRPNRIDRTDWNGWVQERATYMPTTADSAYTPVLGMNDPGEPENPNALLTAKIGKGTYVFTTLALFRQLPAGVPGAARLLVNVLNAGEATPAPRRRPVP